MKNRVVLYPGRYRLTQVLGQADLYDITRADGATEPGSLYSKGNVLPDNVVVRLGLVPADNPEPKDAFGLCTGYVEYTVLPKSYETRESLPNLSQARTGLAAATDGNGNVLFGGGASAAIYSEVDKYTPSGVISAGPSLSQARGGLAAATDGNGNVLFGGGLEGNSTRSAVVDRITPAGVISVLTPLSQGRTSLAAATDGNGNVLFGGGTTGSSGTASYSTVVNRYTPAGVMSTLTPFGMGRTGLAAATDGNGNAVFGGGATYSEQANDYALITRYTPAGTVVAVAPLPTGRYILAAATDGDGNVLFGGGRTAANSISAETAKVAPSGVVSTLAPLSYARQQLAATTDGDGNVVFAGGGGAASYFNYVDQYTPAGVKASLEALSVGRINPAAATDGNGQPVFAGGQSGSNAYAAVAEKYTNNAKIAAPFFPAHYKFLEHTTEQVVPAANAYISVASGSQGNTGYIRLYGNQII